MDEIDMVCINTRIESLIGGLHKRRILKSASSVYCTHIACLTLKYHGKPCL
eukprot:Gb_34723 [translate_table: standard]